MDEIKQLRKDVGYLTGRVKTLSELVEELSKEIRGLKVIDSEKMTEKPKFKPTNNQKRARSIKKAKELVNKYKGNNDRTVRVDDFYIAYTTEFVVNKEKRTVVALIKSILTGKVYYKGIAKCLPEDVWNEDIGKAIALCRGLNMKYEEVEFTSAAQPDEVVVGHDITRINTLGNPYNRTVLKFTEDRVWYTKDEHSFDYIKSLEVDTTIIDDTNAKY